MLDEYAVVSTVSKVTLTGIILKQVSRNTQIIDTCVVFPQWHIRSNTEFVVSFFAIVALGVFYEWLRGLQKTFDQRIALGLSQSTKGKDRGGLVLSARASPSPVREDTELLTGRRVKSTVYVYSSTLSPRSLK